MKLLRALLIPVCIIIVIGCNDRGTGPTEKYKITIEDHATTPYQFPSGDYYTYLFPEPQSADYDVEIVFRRARVIGVRLLDGWYKNYNTSCTPPGSRYTMPAIVEAGLVVRVTQNAQPLLTMGFVKTTEPTVGWCSYRVSHYHFED